MLKKKVKLLFLSEIIISKNSKYLILFHKTKIFINDISFFMTTREDDKMANKLFSRKYTEVIKP